MDSWHVLERIQNFAAFAYSHLLQINVEEKKGLIVKGTRAFVRIERRSLRSYYEAEVKAVFRDAQDMCTFVFLSKSRADFTVSPT